MNKKSTFLSKAFVLFFISYFVFLQYSFSQDMAWKKTNNLNQSIFSSGEQNVSVFDLNSKMLQKNLENVTKSKTKIIHFPTGFKDESISFLIKQTAVMHPTLARKFPNIKSYRGISVNQSGQSINFTFNSENGFYGIIEKTNHEKVEIKPIRMSLYEFTSIDATEFSSSKFDCDTEDHVRNQSTNFGVLDRNVNDGNLRRYRLALSVSGEYSQVFLDGTENNDTERKEKVLQAMVNSVNRLNGIFERDLGVTLQLIPESDQLIFLNPVNDPYSTGRSLRSELSRTINSTITDNDYDVGHLFHRENRIYGNAGCIACVCTSFDKGQAYSVHRNPETDGMNLLAAHEFGHQFGAFHTQSSNNCRSGFNSEVEPGSGSTIMSYAGICPPNVQLISDDYFNYTSIRDIAIWTINNSNCAELLPSINNAPIVEAGANYTIPISTPFVLEGIASDTDNDTLTYCWEQNDSENPNSSGFPQSNRAFGPIFRSLPPSNSNKRYFPNLNDIIANNLTPIWETLPSVSRDLNFVLTVRDNAINGGQVTSDNMRVSTERNAGPFVVTSQSTGSEIWTVGESVTITWDVANTNSAPINTSNVEIYVSTDGGLTFPTNILTTENDGIETFALPDVASTTEARILIKSANNIFFAVNQQNFTIEKSEYIISTTEPSISVCNTENAVFNLNYKTFLTFSEEVNLTVSNLPLGVNAVFSQDTFIGSSTNESPFTLTLTGINNLSIGEYPIVLEALSSSNLRKNVALRFAIFSQNNSSLNLLSPINNSNSEALDVELSWESNSNSVSYLLEIATDNTFNNIVDTTTIKETTYISSSLENNQQYYWRVQMINPCGSSDFSNVYTFSTGCSIPTNFEIVNTSTNTIDVSWEDNITTNSWTIEYGVSGFTVGSGINANVTFKNFKAENLESGTEYDFYLKGNCSIGGSSIYIGPLTAKTNADYCNGDHFYDTGGEFGNYSNRENITTTIYPNTSQKRVRVHFDAFSLESGYDFLNIYDGESVGDPFLGTYTGNDLINQEFVSSHSSGALTFRFTSDSSVTNSGWDARVVCEDIPNCFAPISFRNTVLLHNGASFEWTQTGVDNNWVLEYGITGFFVGNGDILNTSNTSIDISNLSENTTYDIYIKTSCDIGGFSENIGPITFTTTELCPSPTNLNASNLGSDSVTVTWDNLNSSVSNWDVEYGTSGFILGTGTSESTTQNTINLDNLDSDTNYQLYVRSNCNLDGLSQWVGPIDFKTSLDYCNGDHFYDTGGEFGDYSDNERVTTVIFPKLNNERVKVIFNTFLVESCCDRLRVYDGPDSFSPLIATLTSRPNQPIVSTHNSGALTFIFTSDSSVTRNGWDATVICEPRPNCIAPTNFSFSNLQARQVDLSWTQNDSETNWTIEYGETGFLPSTGTELISPTVNKTIENLLPQTTYDVYVKANCAIGGFSEVTGPITFRTEIACQLPNNLRLLNSGINNLELTWDPDNNATEWEMEYHDRSFSPGVGVGSLATAPVNSINIENLESNTVYYIAIRKNCGIDGYSDWTTPIQFRTQANFCNGDHFYDTGGEFGNYSNRENVTTVIAPESSDDRVRVIFNSFSLESCCDRLRVYDGPDRSSPLIATLTRFPDQPIVSTHESGTLTFVFTSDFSVTESGWDATVICEPKPNCNAPTNLTFSNIEVRQADISWNQSDNENNWTIEYGETGFLPGTGTELISPTVNKTIENLLPQTTYDVYVKTNCIAGGFSEITGPITFRTICGTDEGSDNRNYIVNGSFECGSLAGWDVTGTPTSSSPRSCSRNFTVLDNSTSICSIVNEITPTDGIYAAFTSFDGNANSNYIIRQSITIPANVDQIESAILSFDFKVNYQVTFGFPTQERVFTARFTDVLGVELFKVSEIKFGISPDRGSIDTTINEDILSRLTSYAGQNVFLNFEAFVPDSFTGPSKALIDNVSLIINFKEIIPPAPITPILPIIEEPQAIIAPPIVLTNEDLTIYPIPNNGNFIIDNKLGEPIDMVEFYDISGKLILREDIINSDKNILNMLKEGVLESGVYFIRIYMKNDLIIKKIIIN